MNNRTLSNVFAIGTVATMSILMMGCGGSTLFGRMSNFWQWGLCSGIVVILDVIALVEVLNSTRSTGDKLLWSVLIIFAPILGCLLYYFFGRK